MFVKKFIKAFLMLTPLLGILLLVFSLFSLRNFRGARKWVFWLVVLFWLVSTRPGAWLLMKPLENQYETFQALPDDKQDAYVLILGGGCNTSGHSEYERLDESALRRMFEGIRIAQLYPNTTVVLSGTSWRGTCDVADYGYSIVKDYFPRDRIKIQYESMDTRQEAEVFKLQFGTKKPVILVTSAWHMPRAVRNFRKLGIDVIPAPTDFRIKPGKFWVSDILPSANNLRISETALHEYLGILYSL